MRTIYKYVLTVTDLQTVLLPKGAVILDVQDQNGQLTLWAMVDPGATDFVAHKIRIIGTGNPILEWPGEYMATVQQHGGGLVWHIFNAGCADDPN